jgi:Nitroreductase
MIETIIKAAMAAPSAGNQQPWHFIVITDRAKLDAIPSFHPYSKMVMQAPAAILACGDPDGKKWPAFWDQDLSAATQNMLLTARDLGLGTVWVGVYPEKDRMEGFRKLLGIPENIHPFALIPIGWPDGQFEEVKPLPAGVDSSGNVVKIRNRSGRFHAHCPCGKNFCR